MTGLPEWHPQRPQNWAENVRSSIAVHFDMIYEDMLALGRCILDGRNELVVEEKVEVGLGAPTVSGIGKLRGVFSNFMNPKKLERLSRVSLKQF